MYISKLLLSVWLFSAPYAVKQEPASDERKLCSSLSTFGFHAHLGRQG